MMTLNGQTVFLTGAAKGMGRAITLELAAAGADLALAGARHCRLRARGSRGARHGAEGQRPWL